MLDQRVEIIRSWIQDQVDSGFFGSEAYLNKKFEPAREEELKLAHESIFVKRCLMEPEAELIKTFELVDPETGRYHRYDPKSASKDLSELMDTVRRQVSASIFTSELALKKGFAFLLGGGLHHAMTFQGRGFCQFNDIVIAAKSLQKKKLAKNIWIVDIDAHKGDGTAQILKGDETVRTFSIHMGEGWPLDSEKIDPEGNEYPWFIESDVDVPVYAYEEDKYLEKLTAGLEEMESRFEMPDIAFIVAGSDPYKKDGLPSSSPLKLELEQMLERDRIVYDFFKSKNIPQLYLLSGGYGEFAHEPYLQFLESVKDDLRELSR